jgi:pilus assembly protein TadC
MEIAWVIVITFVFPALGAAVIILWMRYARRKLEQERQNRMRLEEEKFESDQTVELLEKIVKTKDKIIEKLKF